MQKQITFYNESFLCLLISTYKDTMLMINSSIFHLSHFVKILSILNDFKIVSKYYERKIKTTKCEEMVWNITEHSSAYRVLSEKS